MKNIVELPENQVDEGINKAFEKLLHATKKYHQAGEIDVVDDNRLKLSQQKISEVNGYIKKVNKIRKEIKAPFLRVSKKIDQRAKDICEPLENSKSILQEKNKQFKELQAAQLEAQKNREEAEIKKQKEEKEEESDYLRRLRKKCYVMLLGGVYVAKDGSKQEFKLPRQKHQVLKTLEEIKNRFPGKDKFVYFSEEAIDMKNTIITQGQKIAEEIEKLQDTYAATREQAADNLAQIRNELEIDELKTNRKVEKEIKDDVKQWEKDMKQREKDYNKGFRTIVRFMVEDIEKVPPQYKQVDEKKVNEYIKNNKEKVKDRVKKGETLISGIRFYEEKQNIK